ncbi:hypothetical protein A3H75_00500 [Candidatus Uhrbacteria bacterium RIFCSPLOWO2_02_FULL_51_9]|uniref:DUF5666 domain-containing protein n=1 Tax=Candidatus Uhrbacteria bacterium RIFCSPLOWO2_02_FULL_51_9 TaxID=1802410 RepID=A0A1F7VDW2_9BACT|nr:MAG: hypothetical protein A3H75_00500 [Candidatus Uhrbacteria bacterium RIFCSPLOWO2_02_FULL_51_9]
MRTKSSVAVGFATVGVLLLLGAGCSTSIGDVGDGDDAAVAPPTAGAFVLTQDNDGDQWFEGNIDQIDGTIYTVKLRADDKIVARPLTAIAPYPSKSASVKVGDKVIAEWVTDTYYKGVVTAVGANSATIKWDDGSVPSDVILMRITKTYK